MIEWDRKGYYGIEWDEIGQNVKRRDRIGQDMIGWTAINSLFVDLLLNSHILFDLIKLVAPFIIIQYKSLFN